MNRARPTLTLCLVTLLLFGLACQQQPQAPQATQEQNTLLKERMTDVFSALEMYALDNGQTYPESLAALTPKYLETIPADPLNDQPLLYQKTEEGFLLEAQGNYANLGAAQGFPQMDHNGFYAMTPDDFPKMDDPLE